MHPLLSKPGRLAGYLAARILDGLVLASLLYMQGELVWWEAAAVAGALSVVSAFLCLIPWYTCRYLPWDSAPQARLFLEHFGAAVMHAVAWVLVARLVARALDLGRALDKAMPVIIVVGYMVYVFAVVLHYAAAALEASRRAGMEARDAELRALRAQINPHFLFNSLNSIAALTAVDPAKARQMCIRLSGFLRNTLGMSEKLSIAWGEEVELARAYLDVEQIRFGSRLRVEMDVEDESKPCQVPPLVLQPLIENAVKHGIASLVEGGTIRLHSRVNNDQLEVSVENGFDPESPKARSNGLGLRNVRQRLETRFGGRARFSAGVLIGSPLYRAEMTMPCKFE